LLPPGLSVATLLGRAKALGIAAASTLELHLPGSRPCTQTIAFQENKHVEEKEKKEEEED